MIIKRLQNDYKKKQKDKILNVIFSYIYYNKSNFN